MSGFHSFGSPVLNADKLYAGHKGGPPPSTGLPVQGPLEEEMSRPVYESESGERINPVDQRDQLIFARLQEIQDIIRQRRFNFDVQHPVDEYVSTAGVPAAVAWTDGNMTFSSYMELTRTWDMPERIESILVTLPVGCTSAVVKLDDRWITLYGSQVVATPAFPATTVPVQNTSPNPVTVVITGGTATATAVNGVTVGAGDGTYLVPSGGSIAVTYTVAPAWAWSNADAALLAPLTVVRDGLGIIIDQDDERVLLMNGTLTAGPTHFELMGFADEIYGAA